MLIVQVLRERRLSLVFEKALKLEEVGKIVSGK